MMGWSRHLHDDRLHDCYLAARAGEAPDLRAAEHLAECGACATRYRALVDMLDAIGRDAAQEADEVFSAERLQHQRDVILRRLEPTARPARVISFPGHAPVPSPVSSRIATRWLAAAAAAGLFVGVAVGGTFMPSGLAPANARASAPPVRVSTPVPAPRVSAPAVPVSDTIDDDRFLRELEVALQRPHTRELLSFDSLTPHAREIGSRVR